MRTSLLISTLAFLAACSSRTAPRVNADRPLTADEKHIVEIARRAVAANDTWVEKAEFEIPRRDGTGWRVHVWRLPKVWGGDRFVLIDEKGSVTAYLRGK